MISGWSDPVFIETWAKNHQQFEFFLERKQKPQAFTYEQYAKIAQIFNREPIVGLIREIFHTKPIGLREIP